MKITPMKKILIFAVLALASSVQTVYAQAVVDVKGSGSEKILVTVDVSGSPAFKRSLERNLAISGNFRLVAKNASVLVSGSSATAVTAEGRGKRLSLPALAADDKAARMLARQFADKMSETYAGRKGFASSPIAFINKKGRSEELCVGYPDGGDIRQISRDGTACVGPRWMGPGKILYTGYVNGAPQIFEINADTGARKMKWGFGGLTTGASVSPDGSTAAIILSKPFRNPELCTINLAAGTWKRLTVSPNVNEGQPAWGPDGREIVYVSDETRRLNLFIVNAATKSKRRVTSTGSQNVDPDWGPDGRIAYTTKRGGDSYIAVMNPAEGDRSARLVTAPGRWEHPSWAPDRRHVVAECDGALYLIDTDEDAGNPVRLFTIPGRCITPTWNR